MTWSTAEVEAISEEIGLRCAGASGEFMDHDEQGLIPINMGYHSSQDMNRTINLDLDETQVLDMRDLITPEIDIGRGGQVRSRDIVQFVILARPTRSSGTTPQNPATKWSVPDPKSFKLLVNRAECFMIENRLPCYKVKKWANLWGKVGIVGLSPRNPQHILDYRTVIEGLSTDTQSYTIFPKDAVENRGSISILLRDSFDGFKPECLSTALFLGNRGLKGALRATHVKTYGKDDKTRAGASKQGWRLVMLQGCPEFMKSLETYDEDQRFSLGSGYVYIRGGVRKPRSGANRQDQGTSRGPPRTGADRNEQTTDGRDNNQRNQRQNFPRLNNDRGDRRRYGTGFGSAGQSDSPGWGDRSAGPNGATPPSWGAA